MDVAFILTLLGFFGATVALTAGCARLGERQ